MAEYSAELIARSGFADGVFSEGYDRHRPAPPKALLDLLCLEAQVDSPGLVVDLGSGTGLSTRVWGERAEQVVGIEPSDAMRARAEEATVAANVRYVEAFAHATGLSDSSADVVTCSQSFHWMEPEPTLAEVARIVRPGGVFAAYDYAWPPAVHWEAEAAFEDLVRRVRAIRKDRAGNVTYEKEQHLDRIRASGHFRYTREAFVHSRELGNAERLVGMAFSLGPLGVLLQEGISEEELGVAKLREVAERILGDREVEWFMSYRVRLGVK